MYQSPDLGQDYTQEEFELLVLEQFREIAKEFLSARPRAFTAEPPKPYDGLIVIADGTEWNPGSGVGYYGFYNGSWRFLG